MNKYRALELQDNDLPWICWDDSEHTRTRDMEWNKALIPSPIYSEYDPDGNGIGSPLYFEWYAMLSEGTELPSWIEQVS